MAFSIFFSNFWKLLETSAALRNKAAIFHIRLVGLSFLPLRPLRFIRRMRSAVGPRALNVSCCFSIQTDCARVFSPLTGPTLASLAARWPQNLIPQHQAAASAQSKLTFPPQTHTQTSPPLASCGRPLLSSPLTSRLEACSHAGPGERAYCLSDH